MFSDHTCYYTLVCMYIDLKNWYTLCSGTHHTRFNSFINSIRCAAVAQSRRRVNVSKSCVCVCTMTCGHKSYLTGNMHTHTTETHTWDTACHLHDRVRVSSAKPIHTSCCTSLLRCVYWSYCESGFIFFSFLFFVWTLGFCVRECQFIYKYVYEHICIYACHI